MALLQESSDPGLPRQESQDNIQGNYKSNYS